MNNYRYLLFLIASCYCFVSCSSKQEITSKTSENLVQFVDPYIGTGFHGHVFLGANVPFGAVQLGPTNVTQGWDWCSGYHYSDSTLIGFAHTHLSGTGIGDLGDVLIMPISGELNINRGNIKEPNSGYMAFYQHEDESVRPGYYAVDIDRYEIKAELTASTRVGFHQYTFPKGKDARAVIDLERGIGWDSPTETHLKQLADTLIVGHRHSTGWAKDQRLYFAIVSSAPIKAFDLFENDTLLTQSSFTGQRTKAALLFNTDKSQTVKLKVGLSPVNTENAMLNIQTEIPHWQFDKTVEEASSAWNKELNKIKVAADHTKKKIFYTALYHTMIAPSVFNDVNGEYRGADRSVYKDTSFTNYTTLSLWDTYRAAHPLYTIMQRERVNDMINTMLKIYQQQGKLPVWHLMGNETNTMVGYSAIPVIVDAYMKGFRGFDVDLAYEAIKNTAMLDERGIKFVKEKGFIPADSTKESVAMGLEYAISDWCTAQMAKALANEQDYEYFNKRAHYYKNYFNKASGFMRGRLSENEWRTPFDPFISKHMKDDYCEGNAWQYLWLVPHDVSGLISLLGGEESFIHKLDSTFMLEGDMGEEASNDISGLIGQYAHGNEPGHHIPFLYAYAGQQWKTAEKVRYILDSLYTDRPDGLCGNEDVGQMSSWYVLAAMGFYQVNPADGRFIFGSPIIDKAEIMLDKGKSFHIETINNNEENIYIQEIKLNGKPYDKMYLSYDDIIKGGDLTIQMGRQPKKD